ncbi:MAG: hypothetical protein ACLSAP_12950 [Oscillospiraceae bacterium]
MRFELPDAALLPVGIFASLALSCVLYWVLEGTFTLVRRWRGRP